VWVDFQQTARRYIPKVLITAAVRISDPKNEKQSLWFSPLWEILWMMGTACRTLVDENFMHNFNWRRWRVWVADVLLILKLLDKSCNLINLTVPWIFGYLLYHRNYMQAEDNLTIDVRSFSKKKINSFLAVQNTSVFIKHSESSSICLQKSFTWPYVDPAQQIKKCPLA
jgi:hypothetical protein